MPPQTINLWALPIGVLVAGLLIIGLLFCQRWRRQQRCERPPVQTKQLRLRGHTLTDQQIQQIASQAEQKCRDVDF